MFNVANGDGWPQLCSFLDHNHGPCADPAAQDFPRDNTKNDREERRKRGAVAKPSPDATKGSNYAYVSMLAYPSEPDRRDYFMSFLVAAESIRQTGSTYDIVALVYGDIDDSDLQLLHKENIKVSACSCSIQFHD